MSNVNYSDRLYTTICSERTLQSDTNGFFLQFADHVVNLSGTDWLNETFAKLKTDRERLEILFGDEKVKNIVCETLMNVQCIYRKKDAKVSRDKRYDAEALLKKGNPTKALGIFCQSVLRAQPKGVDLLTDAGRTLSLALWGRSKALGELGEITAALNDLQMALKEGLPDRLKPELYLQMAAYYDALGEFNRAKVSSVLAEKLFGKNNRQEFEKVRAGIKIGAVVKNESRKCLPELSDGQNDKFENASSLIELKETTNMGRYFVAKRAIATGDTLAVEPPRGACLLPEHFGTNCYHCFQRLVVPIGCTECSGVAFCSTNCRDKAESSYHKYDCKILNLLIGSGMSVLCHVALRTITQDGLNRCLEIYKDRKLDDLLSLRGHPDKREPKDFLQRTLMAAFLIRCLQKTGFFPGRNGEDDNLRPSEEEFQVAELLLYHLQMLQFNAHEIYETRHAAGHKFSTSRTTGIGVGIFPTVALFNHECSPGILRYYVDKNLVIRASRPFNPGEVVAENYGPIFLKRTLAERQRSLSSRYWFNCTCTACTENWVGLDKLQNSHAKIRCPSGKCDSLFSQPIQEGVTCPRCQTKISFKETLKRLDYCEKQLELGIQTMNDLHPDKATAILTQAIDLFYSIASPPHKILHLAQEALRTCFADSGNVYECLVINK